MSRVTLRLLPLYHWVNRICLLRILIPTFLPYFRLLLHLWLPVCYLNKTLLCRRYCDFSICSNWSSGFEGCSNIAISTFGVGSNFASSISIAESANSLHACVCLLVVEIGNETFDFLSGIHVVIQVCRLLLTLTKLTFLYCLRLISQVLTISNCVFDMNNILLDCIGIASGAISGLSFNTIRYINILALLVCSLVLVLRILFEDYFVPCRSLRWPPTFQHIIHKEDLNIGLTFSAKLALCFNLGLMMNHYILRMLLTFKCFLRFRVSFYQQL